MQTLTRHKSNDEDTSSDTQSVKAEAGWALLQALALAQKVGVSYVFIFQFLDYFKLAELDISLILHRMELHHFCEVIKHEGEKWVVISDKGLEVHSNFACDCPVWIARPSRKYWN